MERTNFYDAIYSPVVLLLNAVVVGIVMLLSASGNARILSLFGMSVGTSVAVINYISRIFAPIESLGMEIQTIQSAMATPMAAPTTGELELSTSANGAIQFKNGICPNCWIIRPIMSDENRPRAMADRPSINHR